MKPKSPANRLINETSPYLAQHAYNPVDWYPWSDEAIEKSRREDKPILLSIGYSACHWCHVMAHESFENAAIATLMNELFICIKIDREERPDIDAIYMNAIQMLTGHGGWPLTVFLTPQLKPFYGGTYFPPEDRRGMPGFPKVLRTIADAYHTKRNEIEDSAKAITEELQKTNRFFVSNEMLTVELLHNAFNSLSLSFDPQYGGFGNAPKFPPSMTLMFLLRYYRRTQSPDALKMVEETLQQMANGGLYDHLGGGFARYSVDQFWLVPHFEKMLYDNALLARAFLQTFQITQNPFYSRIAEEILEYIYRDLTDKTGGFYSAEDADSEGVEGKFYVWQRNEVVELLGEEVGEIFCDFYDISEAGNFERQNSIIHIKKPLDSFAQEHQLSTARLNDILQQGRKALFYKRLQRIRPGLDDKIITSWNGLMLTAFAEAANILGRDDYREIARRNGDFIMQNLIRQGRLLRTYKNQLSKLNAYLEDYAFAAEGFLSLYECTFEITYFNQAKSLADQMLQYFWDEQDGGFYFTSSDHESLITRNKDFFDNAIPSGNSVVSLVLQKLAIITGEHTYANYATTILRMIQPAMKRYPTAFGYALCALDFYLDEAAEFVLVGEPSSHEIKQYIKEIYSRFIPNKVIALVDPEDKTAMANFKLIDGKVAIQGLPTAYLCQNYTCLSPATTPPELAALLDA
ncbi:MAG: thioredoxin domain-containing protein [Acidobacteriota bacterium]